jgi:hypothetical protein
MIDMLGLPPHSKKDVKVEFKNIKTTLNELADLKGCSSCLFFEVRFWSVLARPPSNRAHLKILATEADRSCPGASFAFVRAFGFWRWTLAVSTL